MKTEKCLVPLLLLSFALCGCARISETIEKKVDPADTVVVLTTEQPAELSGLDASYFGSVSSEYKYEVLTAKDSAEQYAQVQLAAADPHTAVLAVDLSDIGYCSAIADLAKSRDLPLLFCGAKPSDGVFQNYENCWYVGFDPLLAAEDQAAMVVQAFRDKKLADQDGDYKQSCLTVASYAGIQRMRSGYTSRLLNDLDLGGINAFEAAPGVFGTDENTLEEALKALLLPKTVQLELGSQSEGAAVYDETLPAQAACEIFLCADAASSHAVLKTLDSLSSAAADGSLAGYATPARTYTVVCFGEDEQILNAIADGRVLGTVTPDRAAASVALFDFCENLARHQSLTKNTEYHIGSDSILTLPYIVKTAQS